MGVERQFPVRLCYELVHIGVTPFAIDDGVKSGEALFLQAFHNLKIIVKNLQFDSHNIRGLVALHLEQEFKGGQQVVAVDMPVN